MSIAICSLCLILAGLGFGVSGLEFVAAVNAKLGTSNSKLPAHQRVSAAAPAGSLTIQSEPGAIVWLDDIRRGTTDAAGKLVVTPISSGRHVLRVRGKGFKEVSMPLLPGRRGVIAVHLLKTTDEAELAFQEAEGRRETAKDDESRNQSADLYRRAVKIRPSFPSAYVGLARVLMDLNQNEKGLAEIENARRYRPSFAEASAVEGRIYREMAFTDEAMKSFRRSIREGSGVQPEAHVGLARLYEDRGQYAEAASEYEAAVKQLYESEPIIYQLLGAVYERLEKYKEAVGAYETYLRLAPNGSLAPAVRSIIEQVRRQASGQELRPN